MQTYLYKYSTIDQKKYISKRSQLPFSSNLFLHWILSFCFVPSHTVIRSYSWVWICSGITWDFSNQIRVRLLQGKQLTCYTIILAPWIFLVSTHLQIESLTSFQSGWLWFLFLCWLQWQGLPKLYQTLVIIVNDYFVPDFRGKISGFYYQVISLL